MYKLFLVNHTEFEYVDMCRSNFSQERVAFTLPESWDREADLEIITEFVFREKLKKRRKYTLVDMWNHEDISSEEDSDLEDENKDKMAEYTKDETKDDEPIPKKMPPKDADSSDDDSIAIHVPKKKTREKVESVAPSDEDVPSSEDDSEHPSHLPGDSEDDVVEDDSPRSLMRETVSIILRPSPSQRALSPALHSPLVDSPFEDRKSVSSRKSAGTEKEEKDLFSSCYTVDDNTRPSHPPRSSQYLALRLSDNDSEAEED